MSDLIVRAISMSAQTGWLEIGGLRLRCALGRSGRSWRKMEGDGTTPCGRWPITELRLRFDRRPIGWRGSPKLPIKPVRPSDGWCDAPADRNYNRFVRHPYDASAEDLWRTDGLYDAIGVLGHNQRPRIKGHGSAVFLHVARATADGRLEPTAGCVALLARDIQIVLRLLRPGSAVRIL